MQAKIAIRYAQTKVRQQELETEILNQVDILGGPELWSAKAGADTGDEAFRFIAETKERTCALRKRTIELVRKAERAEVERVEAESFVTSTGPVSPEPQVVDTANVMEQKSDEIDQASPTSSKGQTSSNKDGESKELQKSNRRSQKRKDETVTPLASVTGQEVQTAKADQVSEDIIVEEKAEDDSPVDVSQKFRKRRSTMQENMAKNAAAMDAEELVQKSLQKDLKESSRGAGAGDEPEVDLVAKKPSNSPQSPQSKSLSRSRQPVIKQSTTAGAEDGAGGKVSPVPKASPVKKGTTEGQDTEGSKSAGSVPVKGGKTNRGSTNFKIKRESNSIEVYKETRRLGKEMWLLTIEEDKTSQVLHFCGFCTSTSRKITRDCSFAEAEQIYECFQMSDDTDAKKYQRLGDQLDLIHPDGDSSKLEIQIKDYHPDHKKEKPEQNLGILSSFKDMFQSTNQDGLHVGHFGQNLGSHPKQEEDKEAWKHYLKPLHERLEVREVVLDALRSKFRRLDKNSDASLDKKEFDEMMTWLGIDRDQGGVLKKKKMFEEFDSIKRDSKIDFEEFATWVVTKFPHLKALSPREADLFVTNALKQ